MGKIFHAIYTKEESNEMNFNISKNLMEVLPKQDIIIFLNFKFMFWTKHLIHEPQGN